MFGKRLHYAATCLLTAAFLAGCGGGGENGTAGRGGAASPTVGEVLEAGMAKADSEAASSAAEAVPGEAGVSGPETGSSGSEAGASVPEGGSSGSEAGAAALPSYSAADIDVDLTAISGTMVYSEVNNMINDPNAYLGKVVKMSGPIAVYHSEATDQYYYACLISDATACCAQGIEFELADGNYPQEGEVTVTGVFDTYEENGYQYITLRNSVLV